MNTWVSTALESVTVQQDYLWFCALLLWIAVGAVLALRRPELPMVGGRAWPVITILAGVGLSVAELVAHVVPPAQPDAEFVSRDLVIFALHFLQATAPLGALLLKVRPGIRFRVWAVALAGVIGLTILRRSDFVAVGLGVHLATAAIALGVTWLLRKKQPGAAVAALGVVVAMLVSTTGVFSEFFFQQRRYVELSTFGPWSAVAQSFVALVWIAVLLPAPLALPLFSWVGKPGDKGGARWLWPGIVAWLVLGFLVAGWTGRTARASFEESLLARTRVCTLLIRTEGVEAVMQPAFQLGGLETTPQRNGRPSLIARSAHLPVAARGTRHDLARLGQINPDILWAYFLTLRSGYLVAAVLPETLPAHKDVVVIQRVATARDLMDWADRRSYVEGAVLTDYGEVLRASVPLTGGDGRMLGWLAFETSAAQWARAQAMARFQTFALMGAGTGLMLLMLVLRHRTLAREQARQEAHAAAVADQAKTVFLAKVSHELRTPVQSILGYGELLQAHPDARQRMTWLDAIAGQGRLLIRLVNDLIDLSAVQSGAFRLSLRPGSIGRIVTQVAESLRHLAEAKSLELVVEVAPDLPPWLELDEERVRQVAINLVGNALKFTEQGGVRVSLTGAREAGQVRLSLDVADTGAGLSIEEQRRIFGAFQRLDRHADVQGAGLGLALSRSLCEKMGGALTVASDGVSGSTFTAVWRVRECLPPEVVDSVASESTLAGMRVLVVDDNPLVAELYLFALRQAGAWCDRTATGIEAVERAHRIRYDAIVMDVSMPGLDGYAAARQILARGATRIIGVSAHVQTADRLSATEAGMETLLVKPVSMRELLGTLSGAMGGTSPVGSPELALFRRLRAQFDQELPGLESAIQFAVETGDFFRLRERLHYLKNSADVVHLEEISLLCQRAESSFDGPHLVPAIEALQAALRRQAATTISGTSPDPQPKP